MSQTATEPGRTFTEAELAAIVADRVQRETAALTTERDEAKAALTDAEKKLDAALVAQKAAEDAKAAAEAKVEEITLATEKAAEVAARKDSRLAKVREAASHCDESFFTDEKRVERIVAMDDSEFDGYCDDLRVAAANAPKAKSTTGELPRQTAMAGEKANPTATNGQAPASSAFLGRRFTDKS